MFNFIKHLIAYNYFCIISLLILFVLFFPIKRIDIDLQPYYTEVNNIIEENCPSKRYFNPSKIVVVKRNLPSPIIGYCQPNINSFKIIIDTEYWDTGTNNQKFFLMAHELSHCMLSVQHSEDSLNYMYPDENESLSRITVIEQLIQNIKNFCEEE